MREAENYRIACEHEEKLIFDRFDYETAYALGSLIIDGAREKGLPISVAIRINGHTVFKAGLPGTSRFNDIWLERKLNTVNMLKMSTLRVHSLPFTGGEDMYANWHFDPQKYGNMGGGFPIVISGIGQVGEIAVSGLDHWDDHQTLVDGIAAWLGIGEIPRAVPES